jgi:hypothetical protein
MVLSLALPAARVPPSEKRGGWVEELVIGVPARDEAASIVGLADALELGSVQLGEAARCELVMAYQRGEDDTLERWQSRRLGIPRRVLHCPDGLVGKGRNVKLLMQHALETGAHLLLVDADLRSYPASNVSLFARAERLDQAGLVLPLWCRPRGQGNSTDFVACPLLFAAFGARVRQPLAGQMLLSRELLATIDVDGLPDDYGIDIAITMHALDRGLPVTQVVTPFPEHEGGGGSHRIMAEVVAPLLRRVATGVGTDRSDVRWADNFWDQLPPPPRSSRSLEDLIGQFVPEEEAKRWRKLFDAPPEVVRDLWCDRLSEALRGARSGDPIAELVAPLVYPFLVHAEFRRRLNVDLDSAEAYVADLGHRLALAVA